VNSTAQSTISFFYFGSPGLPLFGALHEAETYAQRDVGIVICYPFGGEYVRSHRACRHLAVGLARAGFPVLRFDYRGTGDSSGEASDSTMADWRADIDCAIDTLRDRTGVDSICLAGLRLGATMAYEVAADHRNVDALVLWEPIVRGEAYLEDLRSQHQELLWRYFAIPSHLVDRSENELLGFPLELRLRHELEQLHVLELPSPGVAQSLIVESKPSADVQKLRDRLSESGMNVNYRQIPSFPTWRDDVDKGLVPEPTLRGIVEWADEELP
jgi:pimeloyl-ACP methyl ester carboxylesterase